MLPTQRLVAVPAYAWHAIASGPSMAIVETTFPAGDGRSMRAALVTPERPGPMPGIIVIHELLGLNDDIRRLTARVAALGYVALAPDLFDRPGPWLLCVARAVAALRRGSGEAFEDLDAARRRLGDRPEVDAARIGVIGFCMGGAFALVWAARAPVRVTAPFYTEVPQERAKLEGICPVVASFGGRDRVYGTHGERLEAHLRALDVEHDVKTYPDAGHSFMSRHEGWTARLGAWGPLKVAYDPDAAEDAWRRIETFFARHLGEA
jgi:carboxymethylenebutenolidase